MAGCTLEGHHLNKVGAQAGETNQEEMEFLLDRYQVKFSCILHLLGAVSEITEYCGLSQHRLHLRTPPLVVISSRPVV